MDRPSRAEDGASIDVRSGKYNMVRSSDNLVCRGCSELLVRDHIHNKAIPFQNGPIGNHRGRIGIITGTGDNVSQTSEIPVGALVLRSPLQEGSLLQ